MAAGQQKKRLNAANLFSCNLQEQYRAKRRKNIDSSQNVLNMRPHIALEWDGTKKKAVPRREQIGIMWRDMGSFIHSGHKSNTGLADVFQIPHEIFGLEDLTEVLSYEVWEKHLSESERELLIQFFPSATEVDQLVKTLLMGDNLHFGNPFLRWGALLCSGNLHPDALLLRDQVFKSNKRAYYSELQQYHNDIIEILQKFKDMWTHSKDPEKDFVDKMWRCSRKHSENSLPLANESRDCTQDKSLAPTADSCSFVEPRVCISRGITLAKKEGKPQKRKGFEKQKRQNLRVVSQNAKIGKGQHQLVEKIKQCGKGIQSQSLYHVLGDMKNLQGHSNEAFEAEEIKKLHEHYLSLARRDVPSAFCHWRDRQLQRQQWRRSLDQELAEMKGAIMDEDEEKEGQEIVCQEQGDDGEAESHSAICRQKGEDGGDSFHHSNHHRQPLQQIPLKSDHEDGLMFLDSECAQGITKQKCTTLIPSKIVENPDVKLEASANSAKEAWHAGSMPDSYHHATTAMSHDYTSTCELSLRKPLPLEEHPAHLIDLETEMVEQEAGEPLLPGQSDEVGLSLQVDNSAPLFSSHAIQDCGRLILPSHNGQGLLQSYLHENMNCLKQPGLQFLTASDGPMDNTQFSQQFQEKQQLFDQQQMRAKEIYMHQTMQKNMYSSGRYPITQEHLLPVDMQEWDAVPGPGVALESSANNSRLSGPKLFSGENQVQNDWSSASEVAGPRAHCLGDSRNSDESLFCVLSQYNNLMSPSSRISMNSGHVIPATDFVGGGISDSGNAFAYSPQQLSYFNANEAVAVTAATFLRPSNASRMVNMQISNPSLQDPRKQFLSSWSQ